MPNRVTPPPMENDPRRGASNGRPAVGDRGNEGPPYDRTHGEADPGHVHREEDVANQDKALPSESNLAILLGGLAAVLAVAAVLCDAADFDVLATVLAVSGVITGLVATAIAWNDARGSPVVPGICTAAAVIVLVIIFMDILGAKTKADALRDNVGPGGRDAPANPAAVIDPHLNDDAAPAAAPAGS